MEEINNQTSKEKRYSSIKDSIEVISSLFPGGQLFVKTFERIFKDPYKKRKLEWFDSIKQKLEKIELGISENKNNIDTIIEKRQLDKEELLSTILQTTDIALKNHNEVKLEALRNIFVNSFIIDLDTNKKTTFISLIDEFNEYHIKMLHFLSQDDPWAKYRNYNTRTRHVLLEIFELEFPVYKTNHYFLRKIITDLVKNELINHNLQFYDTIPWERKLSDPIKESDTALLTKFGQEFISYITESN